MLSMLSLSRPSQTLLGTRQQERQDHPIYVPLSRFSHPMRVAPLAIFFLHFLEHEERLLLAGSMWYVGCSSSAAAYSAGRVKKRARQRRDESREDAEEGVAGRLWVLQTS